MKIGQLHIIIDTFQWSQSFQKMRRFEYRINDLDIRQNHFHIFILLELPIEYSLNLVVLNEESM